MLRNPPAPPLPLLQAALLSPTLEDSDVYVVLHGYGGGAPSDGVELATGMLNLEEMLEQVR